MWKETVLVLQIKSHVILITSNQIFYGCTLFFKIVFTYIYMYMSKRLNTIKMLKIVNLDGRNASRKFC